MAVAEARRVVVVVVESVEVVREVAVEVMVDVVVKVTETEG